ncbi:MAG TPA: hypothetical protein VLG71_02190 [Candidatus Limnocylindria bacterium]|nr:hypothetical protein [Candidatus Limnocylindria bacterium]
MKYVLSLLALLLAPHLPAANIKKKPVATRVPTLAEVNKALNSLPALVKSFGIEGTITGIEQKTTSKDVIEKTIETIRNYSSNLGNYISMLHWLNKAESLKQQLDARHITPFSKPIAPTRSRGLEAIQEEPEQEMTESKKMHYPTDTHSIGDVTIDIDRTVTDIKQQLEAVIANNVPDTYARDLADAKAKGRTFDFMRRTLVETYNSYADDYKTYVGGTLPKEDEPKEYTTLEYTIPHELARIEDYLRKIASSKKESRSSITTSLDIQKLSEPVKQEIKSSKIDQRTESQPSIPTTNPVSKKPTRESSLTDATNPSVASTATGGSGPTGNKLTVADTFIPFVNFLLSLEQQTIHASKNIDKLQTTIENLTEQFHGLDMQYTVQQKTAPIPVSQPLMPFEKSKEHQNLATKQQRIQNGFAALNALAEKLKDSLRCVYFTNALKSTTTSHDLPTPHSLMKEIGDELRAAETISCSSDQQDKLENKFATVAATKTDIKSTHSKIQELQNLINLIFNVYASKTQTIYRLIQEKKSLNDKIDELKKILNPFADF